MASDNRPSSRESGAAAMELALVLPLLVTLLLGIVYFGIGYHTKINLTSGVREGARNVALGGSASTGKAAVKKATSNLGLADGDITVKTCTGTPKETEVTATKQVKYNFMVASGTWTLSAKAVMRCES